MEQLNQGESSQLFLNKDFCHVRNDPKACVSGLDYQF